MKILYSVQATGNGHISRAMELLPFFKKYGTVDIFLSGENSSLELDATIKYRSKGLSLFYTCKGTLDYSKFIRKLAPARIIKDIKSLPVENYDLVINDFECITSLACIYKKVPSVHFGHQASFQSPKVPRPKKISAIGEWILANYARAGSNIGLHFKSYDDFILSPVIKESVLNSNPCNHGYITVYLPSFCDQSIYKILKPLSGYDFHVFSHEAKEITKIQHVTFFPVKKKDFDASLINCFGIITGAGFETPAEAIYLKKKLLAIPIKGQYEQQCNAAALQDLGVKTLDDIDDDFPAQFKSWLNTSTTIDIRYSHSTIDIVERVIATSRVNGPAYEVSLDIGF